VNARMLLYSASLAPHAAAWPASPTTWASRSRCGPPGR
jgi:hypothetical protein